ncbi:MAG: glycoside hydrolase domain-containing protein, partial [Pyrinomonadaceae bacterium]
GQYAHGNEPSHHIAYLYDYAGEPWKTQKIVRRILDEFYKPTPDGLIGNEDCGQMSTWYVLSASGFYEVNPSQPIYAFGTPLFREVKYNLENGKTFIVKSPNVSDKNFYIKSVKLDGKNYTKSYITHEDMMRGGTLEFEMTNAPAKSAFSEFPKSEIAENFVAVPSIKSDGRVFEKQNTISIESISPNSKIFYSTDGGAPRTEFKKPFSINQTTVVKTIAVNSKGEKSPIVESRFFKKPNDWTVKIFSKYNRQYTGGGDAGLIDGIRGTVNFASGEWQGYQAQDFVAVIDLQRETEIRKLGGGFLQNARSWIWMPTHIEFEVSNDNVNFRQVADIKTDVAPEDLTPQIKDYAQNIAPVKARYVRVKAYNFGKIPAWHPGAGEDAFIFVDEIIVE